MGIDQSAASSGRERRGRDVSPLQATITAIARNERDHIDVRPRHDLCHQSPPRPSRGHDARAPSRRADEGASRRLVDERSAGSGERRSVGQSTRRSGARARAPGAHRIGRTREERESYESPKTRLAHRFADPTTDSAPARKHEVQDLHRIDARRPTRDGRCAGSVPTAAGGIWTTCTLP